MKKVMLLLFCLLALSLPTTGAQNGKQVWVFYMGFWTPTGWDAVSDVLSDTPLTRYDSANATTAAVQIRQAQNTGIDAFIVSWFGPGDLQTTATLNNMLSQASLANFKVGAALDLFPDNAAKDKASVIVALEWLINRASHPAYLRFDGKPVIYFAFQENTGFSSADWRDIRNTVDTNTNTIWVAEGLNGCCIHGGVFDGMYAFNIAWGPTSTTASRQFASMRNAGGYFYTPTVHPGWDESLIAARDNRPNPTAPRGRREGEFLRESWQGAVASEASIILIVSWNEFMENSHIEPSTNYGTQSLDTLRPLIADWKAGTTVQENAAPSTQNQDTAPTSQRLTINVQSLNVRDEPNLTSDIVAGVFQGETYDILGEANGWYRIEVNGQQGYVAGDYVVVSP